MTPASDAHDEVHAESHENLEPVVAFARQVLPQACELRAASISTIAAAAAEQIGARLDQHPGPWRWHVFNNVWTQPELKTANSGRGSGGTESKSASVARAEPKSSAVSRRRCELIAEETLAQLERRFRRLSRRVAANSSSLFGADEAAVQLGLTQLDQGFLSILLPEARHRWRHALSSWPGGDLEVPTDRDAPSRACQKLYEAQLRFGVAIQRGQTCVDLGASPGGWSWVAIENGAQVIAVDRSPLREDLMADPRVSFVKGDAFQFEPARPVDWLLSDVIAFPDRIFELLKQWLTARWCRQFCVTIKFRGRDDDAWLTEIASLLRTHTREFQLRRLKVNKNEATAFGAVE